jgi:hypothetical protein
MVRESAEQRVERARNGTVWYYRFLDFKVVEGKRVGGLSAMPVSGEVVKIPYRGQSASDLLAEAIRLRGAEHKPGSDVERF